MLTVLAFFKRKWTVGPYNRQGTDRILTLLESQIDRNFDRFELYVLRNIFWVPADAPLPYRQVRPGPP